MGEPGRAGISGVRLYRRMVGAEIRSAMEYPASFAVGVLTNVGLLVLDLVAVLAVFTNVDALAGWSLDHALVLYGMAHTSFHLAELATGHLDDLPLWVRSGRFDTLLLRPRSVLLQLLCADVDFRSIGKLAQGVVVLAVALARAGVDWTPGKAALLAVSLGAGAVIYAALFVAGNAVSFWLIDSRETANAFTYGGRQFASYPLGIYGDVLRHLTRFVVPVAFTAYYPTVSLLGRHDPLGAPAWFGWLGPVAAAASVAVAGVIWRSGIRSYRSVGA